MHKSQKIEIIKYQLKPKLVCNIQVFLSFTNFYWQFIQGFNKIAALFILIPKITILLNKLSSRKNNNNNDNNNEIIKFSMKEKLANK